MAVEIQTSTLAISVFDQDLRYTATNPVFQAILGYTEDELRQLTPLDLTVGEEREAADIRLAELREGKIDHYTAEKQYRRKDGKVIWPKPLWRAPHDLDPKCSSEQ